MIQQVKPTRYLYLTIIILKTNSFLIHKTIILFSRDYNKLSLIAYIRQTYAMFKEKMKDAKATTQSRCLVVLSSNCSNNNRKSLCSDAFSRCTFRVIILSNATWNSLKTTIIKNIIIQMHFLQKVRKTYLSHKTMLWS